MPSDTLPLAEPNTTPGHVLIGATLGERYRLISGLGSGSMGDVYLAEHVVLGKRIAVKVLKQSLCQNEELVQRFEQEAIAASRIGQENIVNVTDFGRTADGSLYFVMEALEGESLGAILARRGPVELVRALPILLQVCRALTAAHARGIIHRDLKPDNVMIVRREDGSDLVKVLDFGISKVSDLNDAAEQKKITQLGSVLGTPDYMSPEQIKGVTVDHRADIYSLGIIAYELATGMLPFVAPNVTGVMMMHLGEVPRLPSVCVPALNLPESFDAFVLRALEKDREKRFQSIADVRDALTRCLEAVGGRPDLVSTAQWIPPRATPLPMKAEPIAEQAVVKARRPLVAILAGLALLAVGGGVGWRLLGDPPPAPIVAAPVVAPVPVAPPPAPVVVPVAEVAPVPPAPVPAAPRPAAKLPQRLVGKDIGRVVSLSQAQVQKCLADNRALLPAVSGRLEVSFTVLDSGAVSEASVKTPLHATVVKCVVARFKDMRFPKHLERTQSFEFPFGYALKD